MTKILKVAMLLAAFAALGGCFSYEYGDETATAPMRPGFEGRNGCDTGLHGVPMYRGNGYRCVVNGY